MKKILWMGTLLCAFGLMTACGGSDSDADDDSNADKTSLELDGLRGKVKSVKTSIYEAEFKNGEIQKGELARLSYNQTNYNIYKYISCISVVKYSEEGMLTATEGYDRHLDLETKSEFVYDGRKLKNAKTYDRDGLILEENFTYDKETGKLKEDNLKAYGTHYRYVYTYDKDGYLLSGETYTEDSLSNKWRCEETKENGKLRKRIVYYENGNITTIFNNDEKVVANFNEIDNDTTTFEYNKNGVLASMSQITYEYPNDEYRYNDSLSVYDSIQPRVAPTKQRKTNEYKFEYEYDEHDNWIRRITYLGIKPVTIEERVIEYY